MIPQSRKERRMCDGVACGREGSPTRTALERGVARQGTTPRADRANLLASRDPGAHLDIGGAPLHLARQAPVFPPSPSPSRHAMNDLITRRAAIARVAYMLGGALSASTVAGVLAGCERRAPDAAATASALTADQKRMVAVLGDHILPETDTPGATAAGVPDFIDMMMA